MRSVSMRLPTLAGAFLVASAGVAELPDMGTLGPCTDRAWNEDVEGWADYAFDRRVVLRDLDKSGRVKSLKTRHFRLTPHDGGFDERLLTEDGRPATPQEIGEFRKKATFSRNYRGATKLEFANPLGEDLVLMQVLKDQDHRLVGESEVDGIACYRTVFDARPVPGRGSSKKQLLHAVRGSACVSVEGCHVVSLELETVRPIKQGLAKIDYMRVDIKGRPVEDGWVPESVEAQFDFGLLGQHRRRFTTYRYSNFRRHAKRPRKARRP